MYVHIRIKFMIEVKVFVEFLVARGHHLYLNLGDKFLALNKAIHEKFFEVRCVVCFSQRSKILPFTQGAFIPRQSHCWCEKTLARNSYSIQIFHALSLSFSNISHRQILDRINISSYLTIVMCAPFILCKVASIEK